MAVTIRRSPDQKAYNVTAPTRDDNGSTTFRVKFNYGEWFKSDNNDRRAEGFREVWVVEFYEVDGTNKNTLTFKSANDGKGNDPTKKEGWITLGNFSGFKAQDGKTRSLDDFFPHVTSSSDKVLKERNKMAIKSITIRHRAWNRKGYGPETSVTQKISPARKPEITDLIQDEDTGAVSCTVTADDGNDHSDRYDTVSWMEVVDTHAGTVTYPLNTNGRKDSPVAWRESERELSFNVADRMALTYDEYVRITVGAHSRGFGGRSGEPTKTLYVSWPTKPTINEGGIIPSAKGGFTLQDKVTIPLATNATEEHPTTGMQLEVLVNCDYDTEADIPGDASWQSAGIEDDGSCTALSTTVADLQPDPGKRTWVRVKVWNQHKNIFYRYSKPVRLEVLEREAPSATDTIAIAEAVPGDDGASARIVVVWDSDQATGTEVSWSADRNAWQSTNGPQTHTFSWEDGGERVVGSRTWEHHATLYVAGLTGGTEYRIRARRYLEGETTTYGMYNGNDTYVTPSVAAGDVTLSAPAAMAEGSDLSVTWTYSGGGTQTGWRLHMGDADEQGAGDVPVMDQDTIQDAGHGDDSYGTHVIPWERIASFLSASEGRTSFLLTASVSTGGTMVESDPVSVTVASRPVIALSGMPSTLDEQPLTFSVVDGERNPYVGPLSVTCRSLGAVRESPGGTEHQVEGDVAWSRVPVGGDSGSSYSINGEFWDYGEYEVTVQATDAKTGLTSEPVTATFAVDYTHKAPEPGEGVSVVPHDVTDEDGIRSVYANVTLSAPEDAESGDLMELWRKTPNGTYPVAEGVSQGTVVTDEYAPYGTDADLSYVVACRTTDGCVAWRGYPYVLPGNMLRVDFGGGYVELPYDIDMSDSWEKDFEARTHLDGTTDGYWGPGVGHSASISTNVIPLDDPATATAVHELARHVGPCFVRTPDGCAYAADVQIQPFRREGRGLVAVSLDATEVSLTEEYMASLPDINDAPEEEEVE